MQYALNIFLKKFIYKITLLSKQKIHCHIVQHKKFVRIGGTSSANFPNFRYVVPSEICVERNCFDSPIAKLELKQIFDVESSRAGP